jgi:hypothetical protein
MLKIIIRNSLFDIRYSLSAHGKFIILELTTAKELAKNLHGDKIKFSYALLRIKGRQEKLQLDSPRLCRNINLDAQ